MQVGVEMDTRDVDGCYKPSGWRAVEEFTGAAFVAALILGGGAFVVVKFGILGALFLGLFSRIALALSRS
jgi:hypothetical protein